MAERMHVKVTEPEDHRHHDDDDDEDPNRSGRESRQDSQDPRDVEGQDGKRESSSKRDSTREEEILDTENSDDFIETIKSRRRKNLLATYPEEEIGAILSNRKKQVLTNLWPMRSFPGRFRVVNATQEEEDAYDYVNERNLTKPCGKIHSMAHLIKGTLGAGILSGHVAFMKAGLLIAVPLTVLIGAYMGYCLHVLIGSAQTLYRRTAVPLMTYSDVGEAAMACHPNPRVKKHAKLFRYSIDTIISIDLFGSCAAYQIIMATTLKQLVENTQWISTEPLATDYPHLRIYLAAMIIPCILICLLRHLQWLAPLSIIANMFILLVVCMTVNYAYKYNQHFEDLDLITDFTGAIEFMGMIVFSFANAGVVLPIENSMKEPEKFDNVLVPALSVTIISFLITSFFGYVAFGYNSQIPITLNFPMTVYPKVIKFCIALMIYVTHALNFWVPFQLCFYYIAQLHSPKKLVCWELFYRALFVLIISLTAIAVPSIVGIIEFLGCFCLSNMAFIWPNFIQLLVIWERPGFGRRKWMLWRCIICITIGLFLWVCGTVVAMKNLIETFGKYSELDDE